MRLKYGDFLIGALWFVQLVALDVENSIETSSVVFEGDLSAELKQLFG